MKRIAENITEFIFRIFLEEKSMGESSMKAKTKDKYTISSVFPSKSIMKEAEKYIQKVKNGTMRLLTKNQQCLYCATNNNKIPILDEDGFETGEYATGYNEPVVFYVKGKFFLWRTLEGKMPAGSGHDERDGG